MAQVWPIGESTRSAGAKVKTSLDLRSRPGCWLNPPGERTMWCAFTRVIGAWPVPCYAVSWCSWWLDPSRPGRRKHNGRSKLHRKSRARPLRSRASRGRSCSGQTSKRWSATRMNSPRSSNLFKRSWAGQTKTSCRSRSLVKLTKSRNWQGGLKKRRKDINDVCSEVARTPLGGVRGLCSNEGPRSSKGPNSALPLSATPELDTRGRQR